MKIKIVDREVLHEDVHMFLSRFPRVRYLVRCVFNPVVSRWRFLPRWCVLRGASRKVS